MLQKKRTLSQSNSDEEDSLPTRDDLTHTLCKSYLPLGYPMPSELAVGMRLVNTFEECFDDLDGYREEHAEINLIASSFSQSVVSLASFKGRVRLVTCTGTIIRHMSARMSILTSATLVRCQGDETKIDDKLKIMVCLPNGKKVAGKLWKYDIHKNIAVVDTMSYPKFHAAYIHNEVQFNMKLSQNNLVAIGRCYESGELMATSGTLLYKTSKLDCQELMVSTCKITKAGIGGPLIGPGGKFVGMNFYAKDETPFLPVSILLKCLKHFEIFGRIVQPWLGLRVASVRAKKMSIREEIHNRFPFSYGIYVDKVFDGSPASDCGIKTGDLISTLDGVSLSNAQEFHGLILDKTESALKNDKWKFLEVCVLRPSDGSGFCTAINVEEMDGSKQNRWPVPEPAWIYPSTRDDDSDSTMWPDLPTSRDLSLSLRYT